MGSRLKLLLLLFVSAVAVCFGGSALRQDWIDQQPYREMAAQKKEERTAWNKIYAAAERLKHKGARYPTAWKGLEFSAIDLSTWHGDDEDLDDLGMLAGIAELNCYPHMQNTLTIRLGRDIDPSVLSRLGRMKNIANLDLNGFPISEQQLDALRERLPNCKIGPLDYEW